MTDSINVKRCAEVLTRIRPGAAGEVARYLPSNYSVVGTRWDGETLMVVEIEGHDVAGWGLDSYVIPRLASGLYGCKEVDVAEETRRREALAAREERIRTITADLAAIPEAQTLAQELRELLAEKGEA